MQNRFSRSIKILLIAFLLFTLAPQAIFSAQKTVDVYFNGELIRFADARPVMENGRALVPFRKLFETLGFAVKWVDSGKLQQAIGKKDGLEIALTINDKNAKVNGKIVPLDVPARVIRNSTMVPLRFVSENSGYHVGFSINGNVSVIRITTDGEPGENADSTPDDGEAEPYVVKGRVVDSEGNPVKGAEVFADNQLLYNSNLNAMTDSNGYYRIELPLLATTWRMGGSHTVDLDGSPYKVGLTPVIDSAFAGNTGAVRNFTLQAENVLGELYYYIALDAFVEGYYEQNVELTLTPLGGNGKAVTGYGFNFPGGFGRNDVPVGKYKATAKYAPPGEEPVPMVVRVRNKGQYAESVEFEFNPLTPGIYQAELEFKVP